MATFNRWVPPCQPSLAQRNTPSHGTAWPTGGEREKADAASCLLIGIVRFCMRVACQDLPVGGGVEEGRVRLGALHRPG